jgi:uncharacterized membrane protein
MIGGKLVRQQTGILATVFPIAWVVFFITWIFLMIKAYQGRTFKLPFVGSLASRWAEQFRDELGLCGDCR